MIVNVGKQKMLKFHIKNVIRKYAYKLYPKPLIG
jgi:hypothetical protein